MHVKKHQSHIGHTWAMINTGLLGYAKNEKIEKGRKGQAGNLIVVDVGHLFF